MEGSPCNGDESNVMIDKICTELPATDYGLIEAVWNEETK